MPAGTRALAGQAVANFEMRSVAIVVLVAAACTASAQLPVPALDPRSVAPYVPTPWHVVDRMLEEAGVTHEDVVYDLGAGDGRILLRAAVHRGARGVGYELSADLVEDARAAFTAANVHERVQIHEKDIFEADVSSATVVTLTLLTSAHRRLRPKLLRELSPGTRIACYKWEIPGWNPSRTVTVSVRGMEQAIYVYEVGRHD